MQAQHMMLDHPSWSPRPEGGFHRVVRTGGAVWTITAGAPSAAEEIELHHVEGQGVALRLDRFDPAALHDQRELAGPLRGDGTVARTANPDLWDALATAILRQVVRAEQARILYRRICREHGQVVRSPGGTASLFPTASTLLSLSDDEFARLGARFHCSALRAAARAYLDDGHAWAELTAFELIAALQRIPRVGPWTAKAAVADLTNDYAVYDYTDLAVRTWAARLAPHHRWPDDPRGFATAWETVTGGQLGAWTALTLAWGVRHARSAASDRTTV